MVDFYIWWSYEACQRKRDPIRKIAHFTFSHIMQNEIGFKHCIIFISYQHLTLSSGKWFNDFISYYAKLESWKGKLSVANTKDTLQNKTTTISSDRTCISLLNNWRSEDEILTSASKFGSLVHVPIISANLLTNWQSKT
jgi:hypothetical protein